ncbi:MAG: D-glycero-beta-D-manno-heptose-7-phosphate kinase [Bacteroidota bacterium]
MQTLSEERVREILKNIEGKEIAVIGDVMLDRYFWGKVTRISPEAPVPVIDIEKETFHLGGAANVASNLRSLGADVLLCGLIGDDNSGRNFVELVEKCGMSSAGLYVDKKRPTTVKTRVIGNNQQIVRLDREARAAIEAEVIEYFLDLFKKRDNLSAIILEDYNKGVMTKDVIHRVIAFASDYGIPVFVDPKLVNFFEYRDVTVFKPNRKEAQEALGFTLTTDNDVIRAGQSLLEKLNCENVLLTLGEHGMMLFEKDGNIASVPTKARHVADVSGAGDTVIATLAAAVSGGATMREASALSNIAAGVVCEEPGIVSITPAALLKALEEELL